MGITANFSSGAVGGEPDYGVLDTYNYVQNDTGPQIRLTFVDELTDTPTDLTNGAVTIYVRQQGATGAVVVRPCYINPETATDGVAIVAWEEGDLNLPAGTYEGEIEVVRANGVRETLFDVLVFNIRSDFTV